MNRRSLKTLDSAVADLSRVLNIEGLEMAHNRLLLKALKELKSYRKSGKRPPRRLYRVVELVCQVVCDEFLGGARNDE